MNNEEMLSKKPCKSVSVDIKEWSDVILQVKIIDGCPFVCDQKGLPLIGQLNVTLESIVPAMTTFTVKFRHLKP